MLTDCVRSGLVQVLQPAILGRLFLHFFLSYMALFPTGNYLQNFLHFFIIHGIVSDWKLPAEFFAFFLSYMALFLTGNYLH